MFHQFPGLERVYSFHCGYLSLCSDHLLSFLVLQSPTIFPHIPITCSLFCDPINPSILPAIPLLSALLVEDPLSYISVS